MDWNTRRGCKTKEEAMEVLASVPRLEYMEILHGGVGSAYRLLGEITEFAAHWQVPFDSDVMAEQAKTYWKSAEPEEYDDYGGDEQEYYERGWQASFC